MAKAPRLSAKQLSLLGRLKRIPALRDFYLAGGSAVGWHYGHRRSMDLDLFSPSSPVALSRIVEQLVAAGATVRAETDAVVSVDLDGVLVDVVQYPYGPLKPTEPGPADFRIAAPLDLAVMKLAAIARRGLRRDFWALHVILTRGKFSLEAVMKAYVKRYRRAAADLYHVARALAYFEDAERDDPRVSGLTREEWETIKRYFERETARLVLK
ncbi:MAG: nucleotidyl transferase AbiEii/AbiGii toxin family protein [Myxococcota bacterium]